MSDETAGAETPAAEGVEPEAIAETSETTATEQHEEAETPDGDDADAAKPRKRPGVHNRIDELTRQKHEARREAEYWQRKYEEAANTDIDSLDYDDQLVAKVRRAERQERAETAKANADKAVSQQFAELEANARQRWTDYDTVTRNPSLRITPEMADLIMDSEQGPDLAYHFGRNPAEAANLSHLSGVQLAREIGRLEAKLSSPRPLPKQPPAPVKPVTGMAAGGSKDPGAMSMAEYAAWRSANP